jgi:hypothetical protein
MIEIRLQIKEATSLSEALDAPVKIEMQSDAVATSTPLEKKIAARFRDNFERLVADIGPIIQADLDGVEAPQLPPPAIDV